MKKSISLFLSIIMALSMAIPVFADSNSMEIVYTSSEAYEISIPSNINIGSSGSGSFTIEVENLEIGENSYIAVTATSENYNDGWYLVDISNSENKIPYSITEISGATSIIENGEIMLESETTSLEFEIQIDSTKNYYGTFKDTITFTSEVAKYTLSDTWVFDEILDITESAERTYIEFTVNGETGTSIGRTYYETTLPSGSIQIEANLDYDLGMVNSIGSSMPSCVYSTSSVTSYWIEDEYRTITFTSEQEVSGEFWHWFNNNAAKQ